MARHELGGNGEFNIFKDVPASTYIKFPLSNISEDIKKINNGKKIKVMIEILKNLTFSGLQELKTSTSGRKKERRGWRTPPWEEEGTGPRSARPPDPPPAPRTSPTSSLSTSLGRTSWTSRPPPTATSAFPRPPPVTKGRGGRTKLA